MNNIDINKGKEIFRRTNCFTLEKLISYKKDSLSNKERHEIEQHLIDCDLCTEVIEGLNFIADIQKVQHTIKEMKFSLRKKLQRKKIIYINKNYYAVAAALIFLFLCLLPFLRQEKMTEKIFHQHFRIYPNLTPITRGDMFESSFLEAMQAYEAHNFKKAKKLLELIQPTDERYPAATFYIGIISLQADELELAHLKLNTVISMQDSSFTNHAKWYLALKSLKSNQLEFMEMLLLELIKTNSIYKDKSNAILSKIKKME
jgi:hypothetical protein